MFSQENFPRTSLDSDNNSNPSLNSIQITISEVRDILLSLDVTKAMGPDDLSPRILKECADVLSPSLCDIFNKSLSSGSVLSDFKEANIVPIHKGGDKGLVTNYCPVSLLSCVGKVMERCLLNKLYPILQNRIYHLYHGFIKGRSCTTQMVNVLQNIGKILDSSGPSGCFILRFHKRLSIRYRTTSSYISLSYAE